MSRVIDLCVHVQPGNFEILCEVCKKSTPLGFLRGTRPGNWYSWPRFRVSRLGRKLVRTLGLVFAHLVVVFKCHVILRSTLFRRFGGVVDFMVVRFAVVFFALIGKLRTLNIHLS